MKCSISPLPLSVPTLPRHSSSEDIQDKESGSSPAFSHLWGEGGEQGGEREVCGEEEKDERGDSAPSRGRTSSSLSRKDRRGSAIGDNGSQRRTSISSGPNRELIKDMAVNFKRNQRVVFWEFEQFCAVRYSKGVSCLKGPATENKK